MHNHDYGTLAIIAIVLLLAFGLFAWNMHTAAAGWLERCRLDSQRQVADAWFEEFEGLRTTFESVKKQFDTLAAKLRPSDRERLWQPVSAKMAEAITALLNEDRDSARRALLEATENGRRIIIDLA